MRSVYAKAAKNYTNNKDIISSVQVCNCGIFRPLHSSEIFPFYKKKNKHFCLFLISIISFIFLRAFKAFRAFIYMLERAEV